MNRLLPISALGLLASLAPARAQGPNQDHAQDPANIQASSSSGPSAPPVISAVLGVTIPVSDLDAAIEFYTRVLSFEKLTEREVAGREVELVEGTFGARARFATLRLGQEHIELVQYLAPEGRAIPADSRSNDAWFQHIAIVVRDIDEAYAHLRRNRVRHASSGPQTLPRTIPAAAGISAFYFKDPDGHVLEVIHFPPGKGDARWQARTENLFLGIDHTAIVTADTDRALAFYQGKLGLRVAGTSENFGEEQEHLNNVFGARLRITALRAGSGPGIELLEYLAPRDGRPFPLDTKASDLWAWQTRVETFTSSSLDSAATFTRSSWVSPGVVELPVVSQGLPRALLARDPDGHALMLLAPNSSADRAVAPSPASANASD